jgi:AmiR/NasT family two-component response regulator
VTTDRDLSARDLIGRAKGILAERFKVDDGAAFQMLVKSSQDTNLKLTAVAQWLTDQTRPCGCRAESDQC